MIFQIMRPYLSGVKLSTKSTVRMLVALTRLSVPQHMIEAIHRQSRAPEFSVNDRSGRSDTAEQKGGLRE